MGVPHHVFLPRIHSPFRGVLFGHAVPDKRGGTEVYWRDRELSNASRQSLGAPLEAAGRLKRSFVP